MTLEGGPPAAAAAAPQSPPPEAPRTIEPEAPPTAAPESTAQPSPEQQLQLSERDRQFLGARPGVEKDPRLGQVVQSLASVYGNDADGFYAALNRAFPIENYRRIEPSPENKFEPQRAMEPM